MKKIYIIESQGLAFTKVSNLVKHFGEEYAETIKYHCYHKSSAYDSFTIHACMRDIEIRKVKNFTPAVLVNGKVLELVKYK